MIRSIRYYFCFGEIKATSNYSSDNRDSLP